MNSLFSKRSDTKPKNKIIAGIHQDGGPLQGWFFFFPVSLTKQIPPFSLAVSTFPPYFPLQTSLSRPWKYCCRARNILIQLRSNRSSTPKNHLQNRLMLSLYHSSHPSEGSHGLDLGWQQRARNLPCPHCHLLSICFFCRKILP